MATMNTKEWNTLLYPKLSWKRKLLDLIKLTKLNKPIYFFIEKTFIIKDFLKIGSIFPLTDQDYLSLKVRKIIKSSKYFFKTISQNKRNLNILFCNMRFSTYLELIEILLAHRLSLHGYKPLFLICGGLPICNNYILGENAQTSPEICKSCTRNHEKFLKNWNLPYQILKSPKKEINLFLEITKDFSVKNCHEYIYKKIPVGKLIEPSVGRHLRKTALLANEPEEILSWRYYLAAGCLLIDKYIEFFRNYKPDLAVIPGGWFFWFSLLNNILNQEQIKILYYETALHFPPKGDRWFFGWDVPLTDPQWITASWNEWKNIKLSHEEKSLLIDTLSKRERESIYHQSPIENICKIKETLNLPLDARPIITLFPGLNWDYALLSEGTSAFKNMFDWLLETIKYIKNKEAWLIVRIHPAEALIHEGVFGREKIAAEIEERIKILPNNIRFVQPASKISSYSLVKLSDVVVVMASTIGLETAMKGTTPVILAGYSILNNRGFGIVPKNQIEYFDLLKNVNCLQKPTEEEVEKAQRFGYLYFYRTAWPISFFQSGEKGFYSIDRFSINSLDEIMPGKNKYLDVLIKKILEKGSLAIPRSLTN